MKHIVVVELLVGLGSQFRGGVTLISFLISPKARPGPDSNENVVTKTIKIRILFHLTPFLFFLFLLILTETYPTDVTCLFLIDLAQVIRNLT
ncbi:MAG: hypothetical protein QOC37_00125 [Nitrososphaeraceae archaeon]|nr:hypothetical protein [Nitrososphaeraceae archaeon]